MLLIAIKRLKKDILYRIHARINPILWTKTSEQLYSILRRYLKKSYRIIEIGSGTGHISYMFAKNGLNITLNDIRKECLEQSRAQFNHHHVNATYVPGNLFSIHKVYDVCWNSGLIQCFPMNGQKRLLEKLSVLAKEVILFYPDTEHSAKKRGTNIYKIPGVDDAREYPISHIPTLMNTCFDIVHFGKLDADDIGLPYPMYWIYGRNT